MAENAGGLLPVMVGAALVIAAALLGFAVYATGRLKAKYRELYHAVAESRRLAAEDRARIHHKLDLSQAALERVRDHQLLQELTEVVRRSEEEGSLSSESSERFLEHLQRLRRDTLDLRDTP